MLPGPKNLPKLEKAEPKDFHAFHTQFKHYIRDYNFSLEQEALHLLLALSKNISDDLLRSFPEYQTMAADQILNAWHRRICPSSVRDIAVAELSRLEQSMNEGNQNYLERAKTIYIDAQPIGSTPNPNTDANFIQIVVNGIKNSNLCSVVQSKRSQTFDKLQND